MFTIGLNETMNLYESYALLECLTPGQEIMLRLTGPYNFIIGSQNTEEVIAEARKRLAENLDTSEVTSMRGMFSDCKSLEKLDLSKLNTQNVIDMSFMFAGCDKIKEIDFSNFNTEKVVSMNGMFERCKTVKTLDLSSFNVWNVIDTQNMFANCEALANLYVKGVNWVFNSIQNSEKMFWNCYSIKGKITYDYRKLDVKYSTADYYAIDITATEEVPLQTYITDTIYVGDKRYALDYVGYYTYSQITGYESSDPEIVAVNAEGAMIARKAGRATIRTALKKEGTVTFVIDVHEYPVQPEDVSLLSQIFGVIKGWFEDFMNKIKSLFSFGM
jgi:surface protein